MNREAVNIVNKIKPFIISRKNIPTLAQIEKNGEWIHLGQIKEFRTIDSLDQFIPNGGRSSFSWVSLNTNEELTVHEHPIESMVIITHGQAELTGDTSAIVTDGDIVCVPRFTRHGFIGRGDMGFWGLSIQFEAHGLYENLKNPLVIFDKQTEFRNKILATQAQWKKRCASHDIIKFIKSLQEKTPFLSVVRYWSDTFQELILLRQVLVTDATFYSITASHLAEEFGHNTTLSHLPPFPPSLKMQAIYSWFSQKMLKLNDKQRVIFIHLAIEGAASVFFNKTQHLFSHTKEIAYIDKHNELDHAHEKMGFDLVEIHSQDEYLALVTILNETWAMMFELFSGLIEECKRFLSQNTSH